MAYDEGLAQRLRDYFDGVDLVEEKEMFGGIAFMVRGNMCVGVINDMLMARVDKELYENLVKRPYAKPMDFTKKPMKGFLYIDPPGTSEDDDLSFWINQALAYNATLPEK